MNLIYGLGEESFSKESEVFTSDNTLMKFDYLLLVDSRGLVNNESKFEYSYVKLLKNLFETLDKSYIIISRPKNLTTFTTLYNFLKLNTNLKFNTLITNLGFVDCTPKKDENIKDMQLQISQFWKDKNQIIKHENYELSKGNFEVLKSIAYSKNYIEELGSYFDTMFTMLYFINTPIVSSKTIIERERPLSFFSQLKSTNELVDILVNKNIHKSKLINIQDLNFTYDAVHYTKEGHQKIFNKIVEDLNI